MARAEKPGAPPSTRVQLCGPFVVRLAGERIEKGLPGRQGRLLFAYLTLNRQRAVNRDELVEALWPRELPSAPSLALRALLSKLRGALGEEVLRGRSELRLALPADALIDVEAAEDAIHRAESFLAMDRPHAAYGPAGVALHVAERTFLAGEEGPWIDQRRRELEDVLVRALECDVRIARAVGGTEAPIATRTAQRLVALAPYRESGYCLLMEALEREGNVAEALRVYERLRGRLRDELGTAPSADAQRLHERLLSHGSTPA